MQKKAIELLPGDKLTGGGRDSTFPPSLYEGTVKATMVIDRGVRIFLVGGGSFVRDEETLLEVR